MRAHLESTDPAERATLLVVAAPPGVGKSYTIAELGVPTTAHPLGEHNLAWIAERRDMVQQIPALGAYRQIEPCTAKNCSADDLHTLVASSGHNTWGVHSQHLTPCDYAAQFRAPGSAVYQLAHVPTGYPAAHEGIVIDECNPTSWLPEQEFDVGKLQAATAAVPTGSIADLLLARRPGDADRRGPGEDAAHRAGALRRARSALRRTARGVARSADASIRR